MTGEQRVLARLLPELVQQLRGARGLAVELAASPGELSVGQLHVARMDAVACAPAVRAAAGSPSGAAPLLPARGPAKERNVPVPLHLRREALPPSTAACVEKLGVGDAHALRLLACDGEAPLAWVALFRERPFDARQRQIFAAVAGPLRDRLRAERQVAEAPFAAAALQPTLEAIGAPAFVLDPTGRVVRLNAPGRALLERDPAAREEIRACVFHRTGGHFRFTVTTFGAPGASRCVLAVLATPDRGLSARVSLAAERWQLTPRQAEVLARVAEGRSNKAVALELACAEHTVEIHVSALLAKAACDSRAELVARFWTETRAQA